MAKRKRPVLVERLEQRRLLSVAAPSLDISVEGMDRVSDVPDQTIRPDCAVASGPNDVVTVNNSSIEWYAKDGTQEGHNDLNSLFGLPYLENTDTNPDGWGIADVEIYFDPSLGGTGRFIVTADAINTHLTDAQHPYGTTRLVIAASQSNDLAQNSGWNVNWIDSSSPPWTFTETVNGTTITETSPNFFDQPRFAVSGGDMFICTERGPVSQVEQGGFATLLVVHENSLIDSPAGRQLGANDYVEEDNPGFNNDSVMPVQSLSGSFPTGVSDYVLDNDNHALYIVGPGPSYTVSGPITLPSGPSLTYSAPPSGLSTQLSTRPYAHRPVWQGGYLYNALGWGHDIYYAKYSTDSHTLAESGLISGQDIAPHTILSYPAIAVDGAGDVAVGFSALGTNIYAGAYYAYHRSFDPPGKFSSPATLAQGEAPFSDTSSNFSWGDYSGISLDPTAGRFWIYNQYAKNVTGTYQGKDWGTRLGSFEIPSDVPTLVTGTTDGLDTIDVAPIMNGSSAVGLNVSVNNGPAQSFMSDSTKMIQINGGAGNDALTIEPNAMAAGIEIIFDGGTHDAGIGTRMDTISVSAGDFGSNPNLDDWTLTGAGGVLAYKNVQSMEYDGGAGNDSFTLGLAALDTASNPSNHLSNVVFNGGAGSNSVLVKGESFNTTVAISNSTVTGNGGTLSYLGAGVDYLSGGGKDSVTVTGSTSIGLTPIPEVPAAPSPLLFSVLNIGSGSKVTAISAASRVNRSVLVLDPGGLQIASDLNRSHAATLDLNDNDLILRYSPNVTDETAAKNLVNGLLTSGYDGGLWNGVGMASTTAANDVSRTRSLGWGDNLDLGDSSFDGVDVSDGTEILVKFTYYGDATLDGKVDAADNSQVAAGLQNTGTGWAFGDFDYSGGPPTSTDSDLLDAGLSEYQQYGQL